MNYDKSRREFYAEELQNMIPQLARLLDSGYAVEISRSRSGLKLNSIKRQHEVICHNKKGAKAVESSL